MAGNRLFLRNNRLVLSGNKLALGGNCISCPICNPMSRALVTLSGVTICADNSGIVSAVAIVPFRITSRLSIDGTYCLVPYSGNAYGCSWWAFGGGFTYDRYSALDHVNRTVAGMFQESGSVPDYWGWLTLGYSVASRQWQLGCSYGSPAFWATWTNASCDYTDTVANLSTQTCATRTIYPDNSMAAGFGGMATVTIRSGTDKC